MYVLDREEGCLEMVWEFANGGGSPSSSNTRNPWHPGSDISIMSTNQLRSQKLKGAAISAWLPRSPRTLALRNRGRSSSSMFRLSSRKLALADPAPRSRGEWSFGCGRDGASLREPSDKASSSPIRSSIRATPSLACIHAGRDHAARSHRCGSLGLCLACLLSRGAMSKRSNVGYHHPLQPVRASASDLECERRRSERPS